MITNNNPPPYTCAFTGHRPHKLPWKYNEADSRCLALKAALTREIAALAEEGVTDFFSGMAEGTDCYCAEIVLELRKKDPAFRLHCVLPCRGQADKWSISAQERYHAILARSTTRAVCWHATGSWWTLPPFCWPSTTGSGAVVQRPLYGMLKSRDGALL